MAISKSYGFPTTGSTNALSVYGLDPSSLVLKSAEPNRVVMESKNSPFDTPETWTFGCTPIRDIYRGSGIAPSARPYSPRGVQLLIKLNSFYTLTDAEKEDWLKVIPFSAWQVIQFPLISWLTASDLVTMLRRQMGGILPYNVQSSGNTARLEELIRGSLVPSV